MKEPDRPPAEPLTCSICGRPSVGLVMVSGSQAEPRCRDHQHTSQPGRQAAHHGSRHGAT